MILTSENYYSPEANQEYMSVSIWKDFKRCEAAAMAKLEGRYVQAETTPLLVGGYVDAAFAGELDDYKAKHPQMFKRDGNLKAEFIQAEDIIRRMREDRLFSLLMSGRKQVIVTGEIGGIPWKGKIDSLLSADCVKQIVKEFPDTAQAFGFMDGAIVDQKVMRSLDGKWNNDGFQAPFWQAWGYHYQGAVYQALEGNKLPFILAVGTKETPSDMTALYIDDTTLREALYEVEDSIPHILDVRSGRVPPARCDCCAYCRATRRLTTIYNGRAWRRGEAGDVET